MATSATTANPLMSIVENPDRNISLTITAADLKDFVLDLFAMMRKKEQSANTDTLMSREQAAGILGVNLTTLWRWSRMGYLTPVKLGAKAMYRKSDIDSMLRKGVPA